MGLARARRLAILLAGLACFAWPLLQFRPYLVRGAQSVRLGNDFRVNYYLHKVHLLDGLTHGGLPLWSPSEAGGYPFWSNPFTQSFYPLNLPLAGFYELAGGYSSLDHQLFTVLGVSIFALGLFCWLLALGCDLRGAVFAACVVSVGFKIADVLRFPNAVHTAAWIPWALLALTRVFQAPTRARCIGAGMGLTAALVLMVTAAYLYYVWYAPLLLVPYLALFLAAPARSLVCGRDDALRFRLAVTTAAVLVAGMLCFPYLASVLDLMRATSSRGGHDLDFSTAGGFGPLDTLGSLVFPPSAQPAGCWYLGVVPLLLICLHLVRGGRGERRHLLVLLPWIGVITWITYGDRSPLFMLLWEHVPTFSSLRVWGRMNVLLLPLLAWMLARAWGTLVAHLAPTPTGRDDARRGLLVLGGAYAVIATLQLVLRHLEVIHPDWTNPENRRVLARVPLVMPIGLLGALGLAVTLATARLRAAAARRPTLLLLVLLALTAIDLRTVATGLWSQRDARPTIPRRVLDLDAVLHDALTTPRAEPVLDGYRTVSLSRRHNLTVLPDWHLARFRRFLEWSADEPEARRKLLGVRGGDRIFFSARVDHRSIRSFLDDAVPIRGPAHWDGDHLALWVDVAHRGYVSFIDNWDPDWQATVDCRPVPVDLLFGTFKTVPVAAGRHHVAFTYRPRRLAAFLPEQPCPDPGARVPGPSAE